MPRGRDDPIYEDEWAPGVPDPAAGQTPRQVEEYLRSVKVGGVVAIRNTQDQQLEYQLTMVTGVSPRGQRLYTEHSTGWGGSAWYRRSGKNCRAPTGQSRLVIPTPEVKQFVADYHPGARSLDE